jgi:hypothetical protein
MRNTLENLPISLDRSEENGGPRSIDSHFPQENRGFRLNA